MKAENLAAETIDLAVAEATITTNLLAPIRLTAALLPRGAPSRSFQRMTSAGDATFANY